MRTPGSAFGFNENYNPTYGTAHCFSDRQFRRSPCTNLDADSTTDGTVPKFTLTYSFDPTRLVYVTYSEGYRPGGANRNVGAARVDGVEAAVDWVLTEQLTVSGGFTWLDSRLTKDYVTVEDGEPEAFDGDPMPIAPDFRPT